MKNKIGPILLSVAIAFGLWYYVISVVSPDSENTYYDIPVVLEGKSILEERGLMVTAVGDSSVNLTLSGNRSDLNDLNASNITIKANLAAVYDPGENIPLEYTISYPGSFANNAFVEESKSPDYIKVTVEKRISKDVDVNVIYNGTLPENFTIIQDEMVLDYETVRISGAQSVVDQITQAVVTVSLDGQTESISDSYRITLCDENGEPVDSELVTVATDTVSLNLPVRMVKTVELVVNVVDGGGATAKTTTITIEPGSIEVHGSVAALEDLDQIVLGTINLADYAEKTQLLFDIVLPDGVTNRTGLKQATVYLEFPSLSTKSFKIEGEKIQLLNVPEELSVELTTQILEVVVRGPSDEISSLKKSHITVSVDCSGLEPGTSTLKVQITFDTDHKNCGALGSYSIYVTTYESVVESAGESGTEAG